MMLEEEEDNTLEGAHRISDKDALRCALSIPEEFVPTPHKDFVKTIQLVQKENLYRKDTHMLSNVKKRKPSIQNGEEDIKIMGPLEHPLARETDRKLRSAFAKYKKWDEAERCKIEKLGDDKLLVNDSVIIEIDYTNYIKEEDVILEMDENWKTCSMPTLPLPTAPNCQAPPCRLGCICESISQDPIPRTHCGKFKCCLECTCQQTLFPNGDDGDIRSRLRPRVSLLNWRYIENAEGEKDPPLANYRQLERGATIFPRMRRHPVPPQRFRNEFVMSSHNKLKDSIGRVRKTITHDNRGMKFTPKQPVINKLKRKAFFQRDYAGTSKSSKLSETLPAKISKCKPCVVTIDPKLAEEKCNDILTHDPDLQPDLIVPSLIQAMTEDGQLILIGRDQICFMAWTLHAKQPRAVIYNPIKGDVMPIPWLYLPIPSFGEVWVFHTVSESLNISTHTYIPEINCLIPSDALRMQLNLAEAKKSGIALKMLWMGKDDKQRSGTIYIFPQLPNVLICGPFPKTLIKSRFSLKARVQNALNVNAYIDKISTKSFISEGSWNTFNTTRSNQAYNQVKRNVEQEMEEIDSGSSGEDIPEEEFMKMVPGFIAPGEYMQTSSGHYVTTTPSNRQPQENLKVTWNDAARMFSNGRSVLRN